MEFIPMQHKTDIKMIFIMGQIDPNKTAGLNLIDHLWG